VQGERLLRHSEEDKSPSLPDWLVPRKESDDALKTRFDLVKEFDQMVDDCIAQFKYLLDNFQIVEKEVPCIRKVKVLEPVAAEA